MIVDYRFICPECDWQARFRVEERNIEAWNWLVALEVYCWRCNKPMKHFARAKRV